MIKIRVFSNFCESQYWATFVSSCNLNSDPNYTKSYIFTEENDFTHAILLNSVMPKLLIPKENVLGISFEPNQGLKLTPEYLEYAKKHIGVYFIGDDKNLPDPFVGHFNYLGHIRENFHNPKTKIMSILITKSKWAPGHKYRHVLAKKILDSNLQIDLWGNGCRIKRYNKIRRYKFDPRMKGPYNNSEIYDNYKYHIAIENYQTPHYFSEKLTNAVFSNCVCLYLGCENVDTYLPNSTIKLSGDVDKDFEIIKDVCNNPDKHSKTIDINAIEDKLNIKHPIKKYFIDKNFD